MKMRLYSDIHLEFGNFKIPKTSEDKNMVLVLAGDIGVKRRQRQFLEFACKQFHSVIYVLGNHEFYDNDMNEILGFWQSLSDSIPNFYVLENSSVEIDGIRFLGSTLWSDLNKSDPMLMMRLDGSINDCEYIQYKGKPLSALDIVSLHQDAITYLDTELSKPYDGKTVVITHFSPSQYFISEMFKGSPLSGYFNANCDHLFLKHKIDYWFFGHTHYSWHEMYGNTMCYSNQRGYINYEKEDDLKFNKHLIIDTEK